MKKHLILFSMILILFCSCKQNDTGIKLQDLKTQNDTVFKVSVDLLVTQKDTFGLYYTTYNSTDFTQNEPVWVFVTGKNKVQTILFNLPYRIVPTQLRVDLGRNPNQKDIFLKKIRLSYKSKSFEAPGTLIFSYFRPDANKTEFNTTSGLIRGKIKKGIRQSPSLYPKEKPLANKIEYLKK